MRSCRASAHIVPIWCPRLLSVARVCIFLLAIPLAAQFRASITGKVLDASGGLVSGAEVTVKNLETNRTQSAVTSDEGVYRISELPPGNYTVEATAKGFKKATLGPVTVNAEEPLTADVRLEPGEITQTVTVTAESSIALQTENASVGGTISSTQVQSLPQYARDPYQLLRTVPGVIGDAGRDGSGASSRTTMA